MTIQHQLSLKNYNTFGLDVFTKYFADFKTEQELIQLIHNHPQLLTQHLVVGSGSNMLFLENYQGLILHPLISSITIEQEQEEQILLRAGAGLLWDEFVQYTIQHQLYGAENLSHIPGTVGASPVQNIGAYGVEAKDIIHSVEAINVKTAEKQIFTNQDCIFSYRNSIFKGSLKGQHVITYVIFKLSKKKKFSLQYSDLKKRFDTLPEQTLTSLRALIIEIRDSKLPLPEKLKNAGSFFKNPVIPIEQLKELQHQYPDIPYYPDPSGVKIPAAWLIEQTGWKGKELDGAAVHQRQALVIVNTGTATGKSIFQLAQAICKSIFETFGIALEMEVICIPEQKKYLS